MIVHWVCLTTPLEYRLEVKTGGSENINQRKRARNIDKDECEKQYTPQTNQHWIVMNKTNNNDNSQSEKYNTGQKSGEHRLQFSPVTNPPSQEKNGENQVDGNDVNYEDPPAAGGSSKS